MVVTLLAVSVHLPRHCTINKQPRPEDVVLLRPLREGPIACIQRMQARTLRQRTPRRRMLPPFYEGGTEGGCPRKLEAERSDTERHVPQCGIACLLPTPVAVSPIPHQEAATEAEPMSLTTCRASDLQGKVNWIRHSCPTARSLPWQSCSQRWLGVCCNSSTFCCGWGST
jgi:hypothetical protein